MNYYLLLPDIRVQNANAISGPLSYGFPAITAFTGAVHALERKLSGTFPVRLGGVAIAAHECDPQISRPASYADWSFIQSRHPIKKDGSSPSIVEEGYVHLRVSLLVEVSGDVDWNDGEKRAFCKAVYAQMMRQRLAGGSVLSIGNGRREVQLYNDPYGNSEAIRELMLRLTPGFLLMERRQALIEHTQKLQAEDADKTALDALIDLCGIHWQPKVTGRESDDDVEQVGKVEWEAISHKSGWLVPIPVGYQSIAPLFAPGEVADVRAPNYPTCFVETVYSTGEWLFSASLPTWQFERIFWRYQTDSERQLFLVTQNNADEEIVEL